MKTKTSGIWSTMHVIAWIVFVGLCIKSGALLVSGFASLFIDPAASKILYLKLDLSNLYAYDQLQYTLVWVLIIFISVLKALIFYLAIRIFLQINFARPFSEDVSSLISRIGYTALGVGVISICTNAFYEWLMKQGVEFPDMKPFVGGGSEFLLLGGVIYMISQVFKRGMEIQSENELTV